MGLAEIKIQKLEPAKCFQCGSTEINKVHKKFMVCYGCNKTFNLKTGKVEKIRKTHNGKGYNPKFDTNDFFE